MEVFGTKRTLGNPIIKEWFDKLKGDQKDVAKKLFGRLESIKGLNDDGKKELYKASILAFEKLAYKETLSVLENIEDAKDFEVLKKFFDGVDEVEAVHYYQIAKGRLEVIRQFQSMLPTEKEKVLQKYIFDHLWLLHPTWERASTNARIEETVMKEWGKIDARLTKKEKAGRIDIRYTTAANKHVIVELKRYDRSVSITELYRQVEKYRSALVKILENNFQTDRPYVETICILGSPPTEGTPEDNSNTLKVLNARYVLYDQLVAEALNSYSDYLKASKAISELISVIEKLDSWVSV